MKFPTRGMKAAAISPALREYELDDAPFNRVWASTHRLHDAVRDASVQFTEKNYFFKTAFPSPSKLEAEVVSMVGDLLGHEGAVGSVTPGGTMSNILAVLAARGNARKHRPEIKQPNIVGSMTMHPSVDKGGILMDIDIVRTAPTVDYKADPAMIEAAIDANTIAIFCTAGTSNHGQIDPVAELGEIAAKHKVFFHVDACLGGFVIPFAKKLGYPGLPDAWDFRVPSVSSISIDPHKLGLAAYPSSVQLYRTRELLEYQGFNLTNWTGGNYPSPGIEGSHSGAGIASAWAAIHLLGEEGYLELIDQVLRATRTLIEGVRRIEGLDIAVEPQINVVAVASTSDRVSAYAVAEALNRMGWRGIGRMRLPKCFRMVVMPHHEEILDEFLGDMATAVKQVERGEVTAPEDTPIYK